MRTQSTAVLVLASAYSRARPLLAEVAALVEEAYSDLVCVEALEALGVSGAVRQSCM